MPRKSREREREQLRKESKRQRVDIAESADDAQAAQEVAAAPDPTPAPEPAPAPDPAALQLAAQIAEQLGETDEEPRGTILRVIERLGADAALALLRDALEIEAGGGIWLGDGSRRRTPGGVFFFLTRQRTEKPDRLAIFYPNYRPIVPLTDTELGALLADVQTWPRATPQQVRIRMTGRPAKIPPPDLVPETPYVIFNLESGPERTPPLPSDMPGVSTTTTYRVLVATAQWRRLASGLVEHPNARIGVVGQPAINPKRPGVITMRAVSIKLQVPHPGAGQPADDDQQPTTDNGQLAADNGQLATDNGQPTTDDGGRDVQP